MKSIKLSILLFILSFGFGYNAFGQEVNSGLELMAAYKNDTVYLRWITMDFDTWKQACENGVKLEKISATPTGVDTTVLEQNLKPLTEQEWDQMFTGNESATLAKNILYNASGLVDTSEIENMQDIFDYRQEQESRHLFSLVTAERDFEVAKGLALAYTDANVTPSESYKYILSMISSGGELISSEFELNATENNTFPPVKGIHGFSDTGYVYVEWNDKLTESHYTTYMIERSIDSINWGTCNSAPFMNLIAADGKEEKATYRDIPPTNDEYYYRVKGKTPFGFFGPPSEVIKLSIAPPQLLVNIDLDGYEFMNGAVILGWNSLDPVYSDSLIGFNVYRTRELGAKLEKVNPTVIPSTDRYFRDPAPMSGNSYYYLEAMDLNDYLYRSLELLVRQEDHDAPDKITGLSHRLLDFSTVEINWDPSDADDLRGYHIHVSNVRDGQYARVTESAITNSSFTYRINDEFEVDSLFFTVTAEDKRRNISEDSDILAIERPDIFGPSNPVLSFANPHSTGIYLGWQYSGSDDVVEHELRRRKKNGGHPWEVVVTIDSSKYSHYMDLTSPDYDGTFNYFDSTLLYNEYYTYWLFAIDGEGNESSSEMIDVLPYKSAVGGAVSKFSIEVQSQPAQETASYRKKIEILSQRYRNASSYSNAGTNIYSIKLKWTAELNYSLSHFQIFRGIGSGGIVPVKLVTPEEGLGITGDINFTQESGLQEFTFTDVDIMKNKRYTYYIVRVGKDGTESIKSSTLSKKIPNE